MRKVNVYVVTYNNKERLNQNVERFFHTTDHLASRVQFTYHIINNHSSFDLKDDYKDRVTVLHNVMRPDNSCGHLSRDYNAAIIHGFKSLTEPAVDQVICVHDDSLWNDNWYERLETIHETYTFYAGNFGCSFLSFLPDAVRKIGMWDERFCNIGYHEADYFLRARIYNRERSSINDHHGGRVLNPTDNLFDHPSDNGDKSVHVGGSLPYHPVSRAVFAEKWGVHPEFWDSRLGEEPKKSLIRNFVYYPYFERDVEDLAGKNYVFEMTFLNEWR